MDVIDFSLPIYASVVDMAKNGLDVNQAIVDQLNQGDPAFDTIYDELVERFGEQSCFDNINFEDYIEGDIDSLYVNQEECAYLDDVECIAFDVDATFDVDKFAKDNDLTYVTKSIGDWEYDDAMHDYHKWQDELERLENDAEPDEDSINEARAMVEKYEEILFDNDERGL
jgi:hypothetical protein